jgi:hypothetical protein
MRQNVRAAAAAIGMLALAAAPASSEEGMWTFDNFPVERMQREMGWAPDQAWLDRATAGTARLPGCSGANVSAEGLVLTNHHCVVACLASLSTAQANFLENGFMARVRADEVRCPGMSVQLLTGVADVTARIDAAVAASAPEDFARARDAEIARIEEECAAGARRCEVVALYQGGRYALHSYRHYDDVRLVFAPELAMAAFGGAEENFEFPRYCADFSFLRLYESGAPARTPDHLSMRFTPLAEDEIVLIAGSPGPTSRLRTVAELEFERDTGLPWQIASLGEARERLVTYAARGPDQARIAASTLQNLDNALKGLAGRRRALAEPSGLARVAAREADLQARVRRNRAAQREVGDAWGDIARAQAAHRRMFRRVQLLEQRAGERSLLFLWARDIVRGAAERQRPEAERLPRYAGARLRLVARGLRAGQATSPDFEALQLVLWFAQLRAQLGADDPVVRRILGDESPDVRAERLSRSRLADPAYRMLLWDGGAAAVAASDDPMVAFVRAWDDEARAVRGRFVAEVEAPVARAHERIARARFRAFGDSQYPEATLSPRLSYGRVAGWTEADGRAVAPFTYVAGLYDRATGAAPLAMSPSWLDARGRLDPLTIFNVSTSNDVIGGNSGSPLLDRDGRVVGAVFDGNIHSLGGEYFYDGALNRAVTVAATVMHAALVEVYAMDALAAELRGEEG